MGNTDFTKSKERLLNMLNSKKISKEDYILLSNAIERKESSTERYFNFVMNPFKKIAGLKALLIGIVIIFAATYIDSLAVNSNYLTDIYKAVKYWILLSGLFFISTVLVKRRRFRIIDFFGTIALSYFPKLISAFFTLIASLISPVVVNIDNTQVHTLNTFDSILHTFLIFVGTACVIWQLVLYFNALKESSGMDGAKLWIVFMLVIAISFSVMGYM